MFPRFTAQAKAKEESAHKRVRHAADEAERVQSAQLAVLEAAKRASAMLRDAQLTVRALRLRRNAHIDRFQAEPARRCKTTAVRLSEAADRVRALLLVDDTAGDGTVAGDTAGDGRVAEDSRAAILDFVCSAVFGSWVTVNIAYLAAFESRKLGCLLVGRLMFHLGFELAVLLFVLHRAATSAAQPTFGDAIIIASIAVLGFLFEVLFGELGLGFGLPPRYWVEMLRAHCGNADVAKNACGALRDVC